jgi:hypothetical protein
VTVVGADAIGDAPLLEVGTSSAYTPNAGYSTEVGEPAAWGGRTAWWKVVPTVAEFHYIDVLHSTGSVRAWVYRADVENPTLGDLLPVSDPGPNAQGGWNAGAGSTYYVRLDSDGSDVSYVASVGVTLYDEIPERRVLHDPAVPPVGADYQLRKNHFSTPQAYSPITNPWPAHWYNSLVDSTVFLRDVLAAEPDGDGGPAEMQAGTFADAVVADYPDFHSGAEWYDQPSPVHPTLIFSSTGGAEDVDIPLGYELADAHVTVSMAGPGPDFPADAEGEVARISVGGEFSSGSLRYLDANNSPLGDVDISTTRAEYDFDLPETMPPSEALADYLSGQLRFFLHPSSNVVADPYPTGVWYIYHVSILFRIRSEEPLPYEPPPPPTAVALAVTRLYPRDDSLGSMGSAPRLYPPPRSGRIYPAHN